VTPALSSRAAVAAVVVFFFYNGLVMGVYAGGLATLKARVGAADWQMSVLFVTSGVAAIAAMQVCGRLADRLGARRVALAALLPGIAAASCLAAAPSYPWLIAAVFVFGLGNGSLDVAMNAIGVQVEKARGRPIMSFFHGTWSLGSMAGAAALAAVGRVSGWSPTRTLVTVFATAAVVGLALVGVAHRITPETEPVPHTTAEGVKTPIPKAAYLFGLMAVVAGVGEGVGSDWSAIHAATVTGVKETTAALAVTALASAMVVIRLTGDLIVARLGRRLTVVAGAFVAMAGYLIVALAHPLPALLAGWALIGLGIGNVFPQIYGAAGHSGGGRGLAVVVTFGYATFLISPAIMGAVITAIGIQPTMFIPAVLLVALLALARILPPAGRVPPAA
jgi:MFS family permease